MSDAGALEIEIGSTKQFEGRTPLDANDIASKDVLFTDFVTNIIVLRRYTFIVDSFALLHMLISQLYCLKNSTDISLDLGEGLEIHGRKVLTEETYILDVLNIELCVHQVSLATSQLVFLLSKMVADLAASIARANIDPYESLKKFPATLTMD